MKNKIINEGRLMPLKPHNDKLIETVVIKYPDFAVWVLNNVDQDGFAWLHEYIWGLINRFDEKPFTHASCAGKRGGEPCPRLVTRLSLYRNNASPMYWCEECDVHSLGGTPAVITVVNDYHYGLAHLYAEGETRQGMRSLIASMAEAKGLTGNKTKKAILKFFYGD